RVAAVADRDAERDLDVDARGVEGQVGAGGLEHLGRDAHGRADQADLLIDLVLHAVVLARDDDRGALRAADVEAAGAGPALDPELVRTGRDVVVDADAPPRAKALAVVPVGALAALVP